MKELKIALGVIALAASVHANAGCMDNLGKLLHPGATAAEAVKAAPSLPGVDTAFHYPLGVQTAHLVSVADWDGNGNRDDRDFDSQGIVGLWQFQLAGADVDWGTQAWHADGTEFMYSAGQNPQTGNVCQGVWQQTGPRTYTLSHIAMGWAAPGADPTKGSEFMRYHFHMVVKLDPRGQTFSGTYSVTIYMESQSDPFNEDPHANPPVASGTGTVTGTRVNPDP